MTGHTADDAAPPPAAFVPGDGDAGRAGGGAHVSRPGTGRESTEQRATEQRATGQRATGQRATGQRATGQRATEQRATEQRGAALPGAGRLDAGGQGADLGGGGRRGPGLPGAGHADPGAAGAGRSAAGTAAAGTAGAGTAGAEGTVGADATREQVHELARRLAAAGEQAGGDAPEPVSTALIRQWCAAIGDRNPCYTDEVAAAASRHGGIVAPPAMVGVWTMPGLAGPAGGFAAAEVLAMLRAAGYPGVVATNCEQSYDRYLRPGERLRSATTLGGVTGPSRTALGEGYFVTWHTTWYSGGERVARMMFRVLQFRPGHRPPAGPPGSPPGSGVAGTDDQASARYPLHPAINDDTRFFWAGTEAGELRIQRCAACGRLRHPPGPMCPHCHGTSHDYLVAAGRGEVFSYVVHHHPPVPGRKAPFVVAVIQLPEGVRVTGNVLGTAPSQVRVGMPVEVVFERVDSDLVLPQWEPARDDADVLPELVIPLTTTTVVAGAIATRDFTPVHHDPAAARAQGAPEVFLNILTTMGLTERFVTDWAGPDAAIRAIAVRLGVPAYAGDTLTFTGRVAGRGADGSVTVEVRGACRLGDHVTATVSADLAVAQR